MSKFKPGDKVTPIDVEYHEYSEAMEQLLGKTLVVRLVGSFVHNTSNREFVLAGIPGEESCCWREEDLRLVSKPATAQKPKLLDRGDLVEYLGEVWIVTIGTTPTDIFAKISTMTGKERTRWVTAYDVTCVGNIRKKVKRLKAQMGDGK